MSIEDQLSQILLLSSIDKINLISINIGTTNIFIGNSTNMYPCLLLKDFINKNNNPLCEYYLDINSLNNSIKNAIKEEEENNIIIIGVVKDIKKDKNKENNNKKEENNNYKKRHRKLVFLQKIIYLISYRKDLYSDDFIFKNYNF